jgi:ABC-type bacteriocin/lantibiotic exporter with double-glycine peptidase domain
VVLQNGRLTSGSIYQNICGASEIPVEQAWEAVRQVGLDADIEAMPMGMHTIITEGADTLSGGQRQRLMIARALVRRPRLLLLDEATSALDNHTQSVVSRSIAGLGVTRIVIAHRLSTVREADRIYVIAGGAVAQAGTFETLSREPGLFADLARRQLA